LQNLGAEVEVKARLSEEMENTIFEGGLTACCILKLDQTPSAAMIGKLSGNKDIIQIMLK
jgi:hypothetical protein